MSISVRIVNNRVIAQTPYHPSLPAKARALGGKWDPARKVWTFDARDEERVREMVRAIYGTDGSQPAAVVTVRYTPDRHDLQHATLWLFGREVATRMGRDNPVRLGEGVVIVSGAFAGSGGSRQYPLIGDADVVLEVRDVPAAMVVEEPGRIEVVSGNAERAKLEAEIARLERELADLRAKLAAL